ncbi:hypothetical protein [Fusobacterium sp.]|uniref:hypothetical protein n=1 Tax=Fusobacterium sp. TaxID=68766 RepID=UPI000E86F46E|nr:hypothetical protein [Fusobacterium sp.]HBJ80174.1 hypothetical protein [Fusobacterium sp.]
MKFDVKFGVIYKGEGSGGDFTEIGVQKYIQMIGDGSTLEYIITHNLNTEDVTVSLYEEKKSAFSEIEILDENSIKVKFSKAPSIDSVKIVIMG